MMLSALFCLVILFSKPTTSLRVTSLSRSYKKHVGFALKGKHYNEIENLSKLSCTVMCDKEKPCVGVNFIVDDSLNQTKCQMFNVTENNELALEKQENSTYLVKIYKPPEDCIAAQEGTNKTSGIYTLLFMGFKMFNAFCDMELKEGGWLVIQRRNDGIEDFNRPRIDYENGFGDLNFDFWLGLKALHEITTSVPQTLRIDLWYAGERRYAEYDTFVVGNSSDDYRLLVSGYSGTAGNTFKENSGRKFSTKEKDLDGNNQRNCAVLMKGGWWYNRCYQVALNSEHRKNNTECDYSGLIWIGINNSCSLDAAEMKIKPKSR